MTTTTRSDDRATPSATSSDFAGTLYQLRLFLRRDRIVLPLWVLVFGLAPAGYVKSIAGQYTTDSALADFATNTRASSAEIAMYGPIFNSSLGQVGLWKAGMYFTLIGIAVILTVVRHTRMDEEAGRAELLDSTSVGRYSGLTAALLLSFGASLAIGILCTAGLIGVALPAAGSLSFGLAMVGSGFVFTAVAAVAAQLSTGARVARGIALAVLGTTYALRAVGDAGSGRLSWLAPQGWSLQLRPFAQERWWVLLLHMTATVVLAAGAFFLRRRRDVGSGLIAERLGAPTASSTLSGTLGLAWRMHRGTLVAWTAGLSVYGLLIGSAADSISGQLGDSQAIMDVILRFGGAESLEDSFVAYGFGMLGIAGSAFAISAALRLFTEENAERGESVLAGAVGRVRWAASHIIFATLGPAFAMLVAGILGGLSYGATVVDIDSKLPAVVAGAMIQLPAIWLLAAVTVALFGVVPRFTPVAWGVLATFGLIFMIGSITDAPQWVRDLEPFSQLPKLPGGEFQAAPVVWLLIVTAALFTIGLVSFRRRDLR